MTTRQIGRGSVTVQYEDFLPKSEWKEEEGATVLHVHLPDFKKEQLKITYVHATRIIRISGERPVSNNKWSRFNQVFTIPQNCDVNKIAGKLQHGVLMITMPKATVKQASTKEESKSPKVASTSTAEDGSRRTATPQKATVEPKAQKGVEDTAREKETDGKKAEALSPEEPKSQKDQDEAAQKAAQMKQKDEKSTAMPSATNIDQKAIGKEDQKGETKEPMGLKASAEQEEGSKKRKEPMIAQSEESSKKRKESIVTGETKTSEEERRDGSAAGAGEKKATEAFTAEKVKEAKNLATTATRSFKDYARGLTEDRQSMINIGVAVLVIVALGAYISYQYGSSSEKAEE